MLDNYLKERFKKDEIKDWRDSPVTKALLDFLVVAGENYVFNAVTSMQSETAVEQCFKAKGAYDALENLKFAIEDLKQGKKTKSK